MCAWYGKGGIYSETEKDEVLAAAPWPNKRREHPPPTRTFSGRLILTLANEDATREIKMREEKREHIEKDRKCQEFE